jgi:hypothetical protein
LSTYSAIQPKEALVYVSFSQYNEEKVHVSIKPKEYPIKSAIITPHQIPFSQSRYPRGRHLARQEKPSIIIATFQYLTRDKTLVGFQTSTSDSLIGNREFCSKEPNELTTNNNESVWPPATGMEFETVWF